MMRGLYIFVVPAGIATFCTLAERPPYPLSRDTLVNLVDGDLLPFAAWALLFVIFSVPWLVIAAGAHATAPPPNRHTRPQDVDEQPPSADALPAAVAMIGAAFGAYGGWRFMDPMTGASTEPAVAMGVGGGLLLCGLLGAMLG